LAAVAALAAALHTTTAALPVEPASNRQGSAWLAAGREGLLR